MTDFTTSRRALIAGAAALAALPARAGVSPTTRALYERAIVIDALAGPGSQNGEPGAVLTDSDIADVRASGVTAVNVTVSAVGNGPTTFEETVGNIGYLNNEIARHPDVLMQVRNAADLKAAKASGRLGMIYGLQDSALLGGDMDRVRTFDDLGVRIMQPTYNLRNLAGDGATEPANGGLSKFGFALIAELNKRRILVDFAHAGQRVMAEGIKASTRPCAITHSGARAITDHPRNTGDAEMKALADRGGVIGIYFMPYLRAQGQQRAADVIAHLEHAVRVAGEDHVGIGTDGTISGVKLTPEFRKAFAESNAARKAAGIAAPNENDDVFLFAPEYNDPRRLETLAGDLLAGGWSTTRVEKILGGNFARLFSEVWG